MRRAAIVLPITLFTLALVPAPAGADGLPVPVDGLGPISTITRPDGEGPRYATVRNGADTWLMEIDQDGGQVTGWRNVEGRFVVPVVALDGTASGLSANGRTLVLINPRTSFPRRETSFTVIDIRPNGSMRPGEPLTLRGDFSFDGMSPDGRTMFLIEYTSGNPNDYVVREYDLERGRLLSEPVLVPDEPPGEMRGLPITRVTSTDGRWEYTLYDGGGDGEPFVHGIDTVAGTSVCIDLPQLEDTRNLFRIGLALTPGGETLSVAKGDEPLAQVDTETFEVSEPPAPSATTPEEGGGAGALELAGLGAATALVIGGGLVAVRRRRRCDLPPDPFGPGAPGIGEEAGPAPERQRVDA